MIISEASKSENSNQGMIRLRFIPPVVLYLNFLLIATLNPFEFSRHASSLGGFLGGFLDPLPKGIAQLASADFISNFVFLIPCGILFHYLLRPCAQASITTFLLAGSLGGMLSFSIELCQVFIPGRLASASDVLANSLGAFCGSLLYAKFPIRDALLHLWNKFERSKVFVTLILLFTSFPFIVATATFPWFDFGNWNRHFSLQIGNEPTLTNPWFGKIYSAAIYNRALSSDEISRHFRSVVRNKGSRLTSEQGCIALYNFSEGAGDIVHDISSFGPPLDLTVTPASSIRWLKPAAGIEFQKPGIVRSHAAAEKLFDAIKTTNELSIEAWITPDSSCPDPARIICFSRDPRTCNFVLGQEKEDFHFRLRTPVSGKKGNRVNFGLQSQSLTPKAIHVVATYKQGIEELYLNGNKHPESVDLAAETVVGLRARKTWRSELAYAFCYCLPTGFFLANFLSRRAGIASSLLQSVALVALPLITTEIYRGVVLRRSSDFPLMECGVAIGTVGAFAGAFYAKRYHGANVEAVLDGQVLKV